MVQVYCVRLSLELIDAKMVHNASIYFCVSFFCEVLIWCLEFSYMFFASVFQATIKHRTIQDLVSSKVVTFESLLSINSVEELDIGWLWIKWAK